MNIFLLVFFGIIQGATEFLPISSSGHILFFMEFFRVDFIDNIFFQVALHTGTLCAILVYFRKKLWLYIKSFFKAVQNRNFSSFSSLILIYILLATIPAGIMGFFFEDYIDYYLHHLNIVLITLIVGGILFIISEKIFTQKKELEQITLKDSVIIGIAQVLALIPGMSRSGITIIAGMSAKLKRKSAAEFSFLLGIPVMSGAAFKKILDVSAQGFYTELFIIFMIAFLTSFIVGYFCIKYFIKYLANHSLNIFAYYRFFFAVIILGYILIR